MCFDKLNSKHVREFYNDLYISGWRNVVHGAIYIANARAYIVTRDYDYRAALYRALNATLSCVMFRQWLASYSENSHRNAEKKFVYSDKKGL